MASENGTYKSDHWFLSRLITCINTLESWWKNFPEFINELASFPPTILQDVVSQVQKGDTLLFLGRTEWFIPCFNYIFCSLPVRNTQSGYRCFDVKEIHFGNTSIKCKAKWKEQIIRKKYVWYKNESCIKIKTNITVRKIFSESGKLGNISCHLQNYSMKSAYW